MMWVIVNSVGLLDGSLVWHSTRLAKHSTTSLNRANAMTYKLRIDHAGLKAGAIIVSHTRDKAGEVIGIKKHPNHFWTVDFVQKHPEIFEGA
jgi:hypothetical protein